MKKVSFQIVLLCLLAMTVMGAGSSKYRSSNRSSNGKPGVFDYYLLTLSWSPEFCYPAMHRDKPECQSGHFGFVVHGLWPQYAQGYPEHCSNAPGLADPAEMKDIMPDEGLVTHEWTTHGTCSGLDAGGYFKLLRQAFGSVKIPQRLKNPHQQLSISPQNLKNEFIQENPGLSANQMTVSCGNNFLTAVSFCMTKDLKRTACQNLRDCRANAIKVSPIR